MGSHYNEWWISLAPERSAYLQSADDLKSKKQYWLAIGKYIYLVINSKDSMIRAYCWYCMGDLATEIPDLNPLDTEHGGIFFYRQSVLENESLILAWVAILSEYAADMPWGHHDLLLTKRAVKVIMDNCHVIPEEVFENLSQKIKQYNLARSD